MMTRSDRTGEGRQDERPSDTAGPDTDGTTIGEKPAVPLQEGLLFQSRFEPCAGVDVIQLVVDWPEPVDRPAFDAAWRRAAARHPVLRTSFNWYAAERLAQRVHRDAPLPVHWHDRPVPLADFLAADRRQEFDPTVAPVARVHLLRYATDRYTMVFTFHHAILDGRSTHLLIAEVMADYAATRAGTAYHPPRRRPFADYANWVADRPLDADERFWRAELADATLPTPLPLASTTGLPRRKPCSVREVTAALDPSATATLRQAARRYGLPLNTLINAAWAVVLHRYTGERDVVFGVTRNCRTDTITGADDIVGLMINTVPLRVDIHPDRPVRDWLTDLRARQARLRQHQLTPLVSIQRWAGLPATVPPFESLLMYERQNPQAALHAAYPDWGPRTARIHRHPGTPLTLCVFGGQRLEAILYHDTRRCDARLADALLRHFLTTLTGLATDPDAPVRALPLLDLTERELLTGNFSGAGRPSRATSGNHPDHATRRGHPEHPTSGGHPDRARTAERKALTIPARFADWVRHCPHAPAVSGPDSALTYAELDAATDRLATILRRHGITPDRPVALALPRSVQLIVALLAVLKAGGSYLPLDPSDPPARIRDLLAAGGNPLVLTGADPVALPPGYPRLDVTTGDSSPGAGPALDGATSGAPADGGWAESLAYVNFTSGSTGTAKPVAVPHRAVLRLLDDPDYLRLAPGLRFLQLAPVAFDAATLEIWGSLLTGGHLVVAPAGPLSPRELAGLLRAERIDVLWLTAGLFHQMVEREPEALAGVGQLLAGGDVLDPSAVRAALRTRSGAPLVNGYGPTENTTFTCCHRMTDPQTVPDPVPVGRPVPGTTVYLLDDELRPVPVGAAGELYTGGTGLARGYLGQPGATADRFVPDPFSATPGARLYRTGDRARWRPDGTVEFLGRRDRQVKIRGFRVEPGEVEAVLRAHPGVGEVAVLVDGDGEHRRLLAYLTPGPGQPAPEPADLAAHVAERLPAQARPASYRVLATLPLNRNGKVDRAALSAPAPAPARSPGDNDLTGPTQRRLARLWSDLLRTDGVQATDDFFASGGNSLLATRLTFLIAEEFGSDLPVRTVYDRRRLADLAEEIDRRRSAPAGTGTAPAITARSRTAYRAGAGHLVHPSPGPWAMWHWVGLRSAGFPFEPLERLGDDALVAATDALLAAGDDVDAARRHLLDLLRQARLAAPPAQRADWNRADRQVRRGGSPQGWPTPGQPDLAAGLTAAVEALTTAGARYAERQRAHLESYRTADTRRVDRLRAAAADRSLREAVTWQNRHALRTGFDPLLDRDPAGVRNTRHRQHEALVAAYLQRYHAKNDTIGFFGPVGWARVRPQATPLSVRSATQPLATRTVYFENWAVSALADALTEQLPGLRPWLVPRRLPFVAVLDGQLRLPLTPPVPLEPAVARLLAACDGLRTAGQIADELISDATLGLTDAEQVYQLLDQLAADRRLTWSLEIPKEDLHPDRALRQRLLTVSDPAVRAPALAALDELVAARDAVADAAGDPERLGTALADLEGLFTARTGTSATRRSGRVYAGRTLVYEDCRSATEVTLSPELVGTLWPTLGLLLESARWFTFAGAALFRHACTERYRELVERTGQTAVPFADFWLWANDLLFDLPEKFIAPVVRGLRDRWARILPDLAGQRRIQLDSAAIAEQVSRAFAAPRPGWVGAYQHSPDVMLAATGLDAVARGDFRWVVGEVHPGVNTLRSALFMAQHPRPEEPLAAARADLPGTRVVLAATGEEGGAPARLTDKIVTDRDVRLVFGHDSCGLDPRTALAVADCVLEPGADGLVVRSRDGRHALPLGEVVGEPLMLQLIQRFEVLPPAAHRPRITIDRVVIARESWRFAAGGLDFATVADEAERFRQVRRWQLAAGLPRYVFVGTPVEKKPFLVDFASLASVDVLARAVRRTRDGAGDTAALKVSEMLPRPDQLWLAGSDGRRHTAEFRLVAVDTRTPDGRKDTSA